MKKPLLLGLLLILLCAQAVLGQGQEFDFRNVKWGMSKAEVKSAEKIKSGFETNTMVMYAIEMYGMKASLYYYFEADRLIEAVYAFSGYTSNKLAKADMDLQFLHQEMVKELGEPFVENLGDKGVLTSRLTRWKAGSSQVTLRLLEGSDGYSIVMQYRAFEPDVALSTLAPFAYENNVTGWTAVGESKTFGSEDVAAHWAGSFNIGGSRNKLEGKAEWWSPDGKLFLSGPIYFSYQGKKPTGHVSLSLGKSPWDRVPAGKWELRLSVKNSPSFAVSFVVDPVMVPERCKPLYENLRQSYVRFTSEDLRLLDKAVPDFVELTEFKSEIHLRRTYTYGSAFNDIQTTPSTRAASIISDFVLKAAKNLYQAFGSSPDIKGYIIEVKYHHYDFVNVGHFIGGRDPKYSETFKMIIPGAEIKKFLNYETTAQQLIDASIVIVGDGRISVQLQ